MRINIFLLILCCFNFSCQNSGVKNIENQQFSEIKVDEFKKKNVSISSVLRFYNEEDKSLNITYLECDVLVNGKDVGTFIEKKPYEVPAKSILQVPVSASFKPENAFFNLDYGLIKIKSDIVSEVLIEGYILSVQNGEEKKIAIRTNQQVLFSNNKDLYLDEFGKIKEE